MTFLLKFSSSKKIFSGAFGAKGVKYTSKFLKIVFCQNTSNFSDEKSAKKSIFLTSTRYYWGLVPVPVPVPDFSGPGPGPGLFWSRSRSRRIPGPGRSLLPIPYFFGLGRSLHPADQSIIPVVFRGTGCRYNGSGITITLVLCCAVCCAGGVGLGGGGGWRRREGARAAGGGGEGSSKTQNNVLHSQHRLQFSQLKVKTFLLKFWKFIICAMVNRLIPRFQKQMWSLFSLAFRCPKGADLVRRPEGPSVRFAFFQAKHGMSTKRRSMSFGA